MRVLPQISVTTTEGKTEKLGYKTVLLKAGTTDVLVAFSHRLMESPDGDFYNLTASEERKFIAPKGKKIWYVFHKTASGSSTLDVTAYDGDIDKIA